MTAPKESGKQGLTVQDSLFHAAEALEKATGRPMHSQDFVLEVHQALRECVLAVEYHLDTVTGKQGAGAVRGDAPWLIPELEKLEADLARCLVAVWEAKSTSAQPTEDQITAMSELAGHVRNVASMEYELVHEAIRPLGDVD
jgi:hypothetical protein